MQSTTEREHTEKPQQCVASTYKLNSKGIGFSLFCWNLINDCLIISTAAQLNVQLECRLGDPMRERGGRRSENFIRQQQADRRERKKMQKKDRRCDKEDSCYFSIMLLSQFSEGSSWDEAGIRWWRWRRYFLEKFPFKLSLFFVAEAEIEREMGAQRNWNWQRKKKVFRLLLPHSLSSFSPLWQSGVRRNFNHQQRVLGMKEFRLTRHLCHTSHQLVSNSFVVVITSQSSV